MRYALFFLLILGVFTARSQEIVFKVEVSADSVLTGNSLEVRFTIENAGGDFKAPDFDGFEVISGPNTSSSFSMVNGNVTQKASYSYRIKPLREGKLYILPATFKTKKSTLETEPLVIQVYPNPAGIIEDKRFRDDAEESFPGFRQSRPGKEDPLRDKRRKI